jgi:putative two-component system response regulator
LVFRYAPLHDIGNVGIPDRILLEPGWLTPGEFEIMQRHTTLGREAIETLPGGGGAFPGFGPEGAVAPPTLTDF